MANYAFNETVAARRRTAEFILATPDVLAEFVERGGLPRDLEAISAMGKAAEDANLGQSAASAVGVASTLDLMGAFSRLQREYKSVMAVVRAVRDDLEESGAGTEVVERVNQILSDETAVHVKTVRGEGDATVRKTLKKLSQEAVRAEIRKDAAALLDHPSILAALAARRVDAARLEKLRDDADALSGRLSSRVADKAQRKLATSLENEAVKAQRKKWGSVYRIIGAMHDERVRGLLQASAR